MMIESLGKPHCRQDSSCCEQFSLLTHVNHKKNLGTRSLPQLVTGLTLMDVSCLSTTITYSRLTCHNLIEGDTILSNTIISGKEDRS